MLLRWADEADAGPLADIFYSAVRNGAKPAYSEAVLKAWVPERPTADGWAKRIEGLETAMAEADGDALGFMSVNLRDGDLDLAFVRPDRRRSGLADSLYAMIENRARAAGLPRLHSHASHMARPFLERQGWGVVRPGQVSRGGVIIDNWVMEKHLCRDRT